MPSTPPRSAGSRLDNDLRELQFKKNQYGPMGETIVVRYQSGLFVPVHGMTTLERAARETEIDGIFLDLLRTFEAQNRLVSDKAGRNYAPAVFAQEESPERPA